MSLSDTKEKSNGSKLCRLLIDGGTKALRSIFNGFYPPATLSGTFYSYLPVLTRLRGRVLNNSQWDKLFPPGGVPPDSTNFDVTLLFILLRNICGLPPPSTGWDQLPPETDTTLEAKLARIKYFRNEVYGYICSTSVEDSKFESLWRDISSALVALGLDQNEVDSLKYEMTSTDYFKLLKEWAVQDQDLKLEILKTRLVAEKSFEILHQIKAEKTVPNAEPRLATYTLQINDAEPRLATYTPQINDSDAVKEADIATKHLIYLPRSRMELGMCTLESGLVKRREKT